MTNLNDHPVTNDVVRSSALWFWGFPEPKCWLTYLHRDIGLKSETTSLGPHPLRCGWPMRGERPLAWSVLRHLQPPEWLLILHTMHGGASPNRPSEVAGSVLNEDC